MMYDIIPMVVKITNIDIKPMGLPNIKSNQNAISKSSFADVYKDVMAKLALLDVVYADLDQLMMPKHF